MKTAKPGVIDLYFRLTNAYSILHLLTEVEDDQIRGPAIVRLTVAELLQLLTSQRRASSVALEIPRITTGTMLSTTTSSTTTFKCRSRCEYLNHIIGSQLFIKSQEAVMKTIRSST